MMEQKRNYQRELDELLNHMEPGAKTLLLHGCCAPCSSYCLEYLSSYFQITLYFYNPNIENEEEYERRLGEAKRLISSIPQKYPIQLIDPGYNHDEFLEVAKGYELCPEGGARCARCFRLRLLSAGNVAKAGNYDFFTTTLTISPLKNASLLNQIGEEIASELGIQYLPTDFKKRGGYLRSCELSREYGLYRQDYCGCEFSKVEREKIKQI